VDLEELIHFLEGVRQIVVMVFRSMPELLKIGFMRIRKSHKFHASHSLKMVCQRSFLGGLGKQIAVYSRPERPKDANGGSLSAFGSD
jgi:hypothetical protein